jgi:hypothetical protein
VIGYEIASHLAVNVLFPTLPSSILFPSTHPLNVYPSFVGLFNVIVSLSIVYDDGFHAPFVHPFNSYVIVYVIGLHSAVISFAHIAVFEILLGVHPTKLYHLFSPLANDVTHIPYVYVLGFKSAFVHPFSTYVIGYVFASHVAVNTFVHVLHCNIIFHPSHPLNVYPSLLGLFNWIKSSTVYVDGFTVALFDPSIFLYSIVYSVASFHSATNVLSPVVQFAIHVTFTPFSVHPENSYPSLLGSTNAIVALSIVYDDGLFPFVHPFNS